MRHREALAWRKLHFISGRSFFSAPARLRDRVLRHTLLGYPYGLQGNKLAHRGKVDALIGVT